LMELRVCPECRKAFYAPPEGTHLLCPHCGFALLDRRDETRTIKDVDFHLVLGSTEIQARLKDLSRGGFRAEYSGRSLELDALLRVDIEGLGIHQTARTVWSKRISKSRYSSGFKFLTV